MNKLYEAVIALGRSMQNIDYFGWMQEELGDWDGEKCAIGHISFTLIGNPEYTHGIAFQLMHPHEAMTSRVALRALCEALTEDQLALVGQYVAATQSDYSIRAFKIAGTGNGTAADYAEVVAIANDEAMRSKAEVKAWFSAAIDVLAKELPIPPAPMDVSDVEMESYLWSFAPEMGRARSAV